MNVSGGPVEKGRMSMIILPAICVLKWMGGRLMGASSGSWSGLEDNVADLPSQVNVPKTRRTYCKGKDCKKHTQHKVTQYKAGKVWTGRTIHGNCTILTTFSGLPLRPG